MASYGIPSLDEFKNKQSEGTASFTYGIGKTLNLANSPIVDPIIRDAAKTEEYVKTAPKTSQPIDLIKAASAPSQNTFLKEVGSSMDSPANKLYEESTLLQEFRTKAKKPESPIETVTKLAQPKEAFDVVNNSPSDLNSKATLNRLKQALADKESYGGRYDLQSNVSSAVGKYQFLWGTWGKEIQRVTGADRDTFLKTPKKQEEFFDWYYNSKLLPAAKRLQKTAESKGFSLYDTVKLVHFRGEAGTRSILKKDREQLAKRDMKNNMAILEYLNETKAKKGKK